MNILLVAKKTWLEELRDSRTEEELQKERDYPVLLESHEAHYRTLAQLEEALTAEGLPYQLAPFQFSERHYQGKDLVIAVGGDGTFLHAAQYVKGAVMLLGLKSDPKSRGYLLSTDAYDIPTKVRLLAEGAFDIQLRTRLEISIDGLVRDLAVNEAYIGHKDRVTSRYILHHLGLQESQMSSGLVVAVGSGSTAWLRAIAHFGDVQRPAPFPLDARLAKLRVREPFEDYQLLKGDLLDGETLSVDSLMNHGGVVAVDGATIDKMAHRMYPLNRSSRAEIRLAQEPLFSLDFF